MRQAASDAQDSIGKRDFDGAISLLEASLSQYPDEKLLKETLASARKGAEAKRRDDAIEALIREAHVQANQHDLQRALKTVDQGLVEFGNDKRFAEARAKVMSAKADWERAEAIRSVLEDSNTLLAQQQPAAAVERLETALELYHGDKQLTEARDAARNALSALGREQAISALLSKRGTYWTRETSETQLAHWSMG